MLACIRQRRDEAGGGRRFPFTARALSFYTRTTRGQCDRGSPTAQRCRLTGRHHPARAVFLQFVSLPRGGDLRRPGVQPVRRRMGEGGAAAARPAGGHRLSRGCIAAAGQHRSPAPAPDRRHQLVAADRHHGRFAGAGCTGGPDPGAADAAGQRRHCRVAAAAARVPVRLDGLHRRAVSVPVLALECHSRAAFAARNCRAGRRLLRRCGPCCAISAVTCARPRRWRPSAAQTC